MANDVSAEARRYLVQLPLHVRSRLAARLIHDLLIEIERLREKLDDAKHGLELAESEIVGLRQEIEHWKLKAECVKHGDQWQAGCG